MGERPLTPSTLLSLGAMLALAACNDPPCDEEAAAKAAEACKTCVSMAQNGDGGVNCGHRAYETYCGEHPAKPIR